jgi:hypothetical protein
MGAGIALEAKTRYPSIPYEFGAMVKNNGNKVQITEIDGITFVAFPVKHNWKDEADLALIKKSADELVELADKMNWSKVLLPRPGCGNGRLKWESVSETLSVLDDRFHIISL